MVMILWCARSARFIKRLPLNIATLVMCTIYLRVVWWIVFDMDVWLDEHF